MIGKPTRLRQRLRSRPHFRKVYSSRISSHPAGAQIHRKRARTCCEGPFAEVLRTTGPMAKSNPFRFSTKYQDEETDLLCYGYRYEGGGRWLSRDPIEEKGGVNLYGFVSQNAVNKVDANGREIGQVCPICHQYYVGMHVCEPHDDDEAAVSWAPAPCPRGLGTIYIQVLYGGIGPYSGPRVDDGSVGFYGGGSKGCPDYKTASTSPDIFQDTPHGLTGPVEFIVCRVCTTPCCAGIRFINGRNGVNSSYPISGYSIASVGPCVHWKKGDKGDLSDADTFLTFRGPPQAWTDGMNRDYPGVASGRCTPTCGL